MIWIGLPSSLSPQRGDIRQAARKLSLVLWVAGGLLASASASARDTQALTGMPSVALATLPVQAQSTHRLILVGGPFPYDKDGTVFGNREGRLPGAARGHYREYTVTTPGVSHRGARRIVCGGKPPTQPDACYYTTDHYASFQRIAQ